jgi:hypothetical protein
MTLQKITEKDLKRKINKAHKMLVEKDNPENPNCTPIASYLMAYSAELNNRSSRRFALWSIILVIVSIFVQLFDCTI